MPRYSFTLDGPLLPGVEEELADDIAAKRHACIIADEINRNAERPLPVLVLDQDGMVLAAVRPTEE